MSTRGTGSSPHARGALLHETGGRRGSRIIPACAGSTRWRTERSALTRDHPRMRGEHLTSAPVPIVQVGSSPHARGARQAGEDHERVGGIIPACAGSTRGKHLFRLDTGNHPRMRGEHFSLRAEQLVLSGSSPHARGAPWSSALRADRRRDHPRMRGSTPRRGRSYGLSTGSSPHARGVPMLQVNDTALIGIIPACAGSTRRTDTWRSRHRDHPRMRGEHTIAILTLTRRMGSSPHARGAQNAWRALAPS